MQVVARLSIALALILLFSGKQSLFAQQSSLTTENQTSVTFDKTIKPFLSTYCGQCHGAKEQKGERRFDQLTETISDETSLVLWQDILDQLNLSEMPPSKSKQPTTENRRAVVSWLTERIRQYHLDHQTQTKQTVLRRMNAREYKNTVRDLLQIEMTMFDPTANFPRDQTSEHLDNVAATLVTSGHLLAQYLNAADQVINKALIALKKPDVQTWSFRDDFKQQPEIDQVHKKVNQFQHMTLYDVIGADKPEGAYGPILAFRNGVPVDGFYDIRIKVQAVNRLHPYDPDFLGTDRDEPLQLGIVAGNDRVGSLHTSQPIEPLLAKLDLADQSQWYKVRVWLDAGYTPRFTFRNGLMDVRNLWSRLLKKYPDQFPKPKNQGIVENRFNAIKYGKLPQIQIHEIEIEGPIYNAWPTASQHAIFGDKAKQILTDNSMSFQQMRTGIKAFASRAYRRPATSEEVQVVMQVIATRQKQGRTSVEAYCDGLKAVLCSPNFLYIEAATDSQPGYTLATRLSYFLWSSMPDQELLKLAASGKLQQEEVLKAQVERMLQDPKSDAFVNGFLDSWLTLRDLGSSPPDRDKFREYYHYDLDAAMRKETFLFTRHLLDQNLSILNFLDSDFTFVNKRLAVHYRLKLPEENANLNFDQFQKVEISDHRRGGLLGQASVLTVTANGIDTSPVVRGVWLLENIFGTPPSPPPPDVEPLDPDIRGAKTIRDQLKKHRSIASCNDCHQKIDPPGFALENFDPIGKWRDTYGKRTKIDAAGELPGGKSFENVVGLKKILVLQKKQFAKALVEKLLAYGTGRHLHVSDRRHIDRIVANLEQTNYGFRNLVKQVVLSEPFRDVAFSD